MTDCDTRVEATFDQDIEDDAGAHVFIDKSSLACMQDSAKRLHVPMSIVEQRLVQLHNAALSVFVAMC